MGLLDDLKEIGQFRRYKNRESNIERELLKRTISDTIFTKNMNSYMEALIRDLNKRFGEEGLTEVHYKPKTLKDSQFFEAFRTEDRMTEVYNIVPLNDGSYRFTLRDIENFELLMEYLEDETNEGEAYENGELRREEEMYREGYIHDDDY